MRRLPGLAAISLSALALSGCATMSVSSHVQRGLDFAQYRTYDWSQADALPAGDPRLDGNPFFRDHLAGAIEKQLALKGLERSTAGAADLLVHYHANISRRLDVNRLDREFGYCYDASCRARVFDYEAGTLVVDIVDTRTHLLIWRGWARHGVDDVLGNEDRMARTVNEAVRRMLARFPRSVEGGE